MTPEYREWLTELFARFGAVSVKHFFNLNGLFLDDIMFGLVADDRIYFKTDEQSRKIFEREGVSALTYVMRDGERIVTSYWEVPQHLYDEPDQLVHWAKRAYEIALLSPTAKRKLARKARQSSARELARQRKRS